MKIKRAALNIAAILLAFTTGVAISTCWKRVTYRTVEVQEPRAELRVRPVAQLVTPVASESLFGGRLKIVPTLVQLKSESLRYDIDMRYPQFVGADERYVQKLNRRIETQAVDHYQWALHPSKENLIYYKRMHPEAFNSVDFDYEIVSATDSLISIYFNSYDYGIGAAHMVQSSFTINYALTSRKELKLSDVFDSNSKYLQFIADYCRDEVLSDGNARRYLFRDTLTAQTDVFESWNITANGIRFNFDECKVTACAAADLKVEIPFSVLKPFLNPTFRSNR